MKKLFIFLMVFAATEATGGGSSLEGANETDKKAGTSTTPDAPQQPGAQQTSDAAEDLEDEGAEGEDDQEKGE